MEQCWDSVNGRYAVHATSSFRARASQREPGIQWAVPTSLVPQTLDSGFGLRPPRNDAVFCQGAGYLAPGAMIARTSAMMSGGVA